MDDNHDEGSLLESFQTSTDEEPETPPETSAPSPDLSFTLPEGPADFDAAALPNDPNVEEELSVAEEPTFEAAIPGEDLAEPADAVDQMLGEAVAAEEAAASESSQANPDQAKAEFDKTAIFSLAVYGPITQSLWNQAAQSIELRSLGLPQEAPKARLLVSRLTDYQAASAAIVLKARGILAEPLSPTSAPTEAHEVASEGAPQVALPKNAKDVLLYSGDEPLGFQVQRIEGIITAHRSIARRFFRDLEAQDILNRELQKLHKPSKIRKLFPTSAMERLFGDLFLELQKAALSRGANGVVALRVEAFPESSNLDADLEQMRLVALGTAAVVEKA